MAALYRLDVMVRGNSTITQDDAVRWTKNWVNDRQAQDSSKEFYADLFDSRTSKAFKVFSDVATHNRAIANSYVCEDGEVIEGVIYTTSFMDEMERLKIEVAFLKAELYGESQNSVKILV